LNQGDSNRNRNIGKNRFDGSIEEEQKQNDIGEIELEGFEEEKKQ